MPISACKSTEGLIKLDNPDGTSATKVQALEYFAKEIKPAYPLTKPYDEVICEDKGNFYFNLDATGRKLSEAAQEVSKAKGMPFALRIALREVNGHLNEPDTGFVTRLKTQCDSLTVTHKIYTDRLGSSGVSGLIYGTMAMMGAFGIAVPLVEDMSRLSSVFQAKKNSYNAEYNRLASDYGICAADGTTPINLPLNNDVSEAKTENLGLLGMGVLLGAAVAGREILTQIKSKIFSSDESPYDFCKFSVEEYAVIAGLDTEKMSEADLKTAFEKWSQVDSDLQGRIKKADEEYNGMKPELGEKAKKDTLLADGTLVKQGETFKPGAIIKKGLNDKLKELDQNPEFPLYNTVVEFGIGVPLGHILKSKFKRWLLRKFSPDLFKSNAEIKAGKDLANKFAKGEVKMCKPVDADLAAEAKDWAEGVLGKPIAAKPEMKRIDTSDALVPPVGYQVLEPASKLAAQKVSPAGKLLAPTPLAPTPGLKAGSLLKAPAAGFGFKPPLPI